ncbi:MAG TPA: hypothetical protein VHU13_07660 [Solirubrobacteraceae bacterium]|jgi:hypothetical protein|nr:hypothetical protein [Solirubrobacteraceae bacterium]
MRPPKTGRRPLVAGTALLLSAALCFPSASLAAPAKPPSASTGGVEQRTYSSAILNATINPHGVETNYYFQYGATSVYGAQTPTAPVGSATTPTAAKQTLTGLQTGISYHYRVVAVSGAGTTFGRDRVFSTRSVTMRFELPRTPRLAAFGSSISISGLLMGTGGAGRQVQLQADQFPFLSGFANLGAPVLTDGEGRFTFRVSGLSQNTQLRVSTLDPSPLRSTIVKVNVSPRVTLHVRKTRTIGVVRLYGTVSPALAGRSIAFQLLRNGAAHTIASAALTKRTAGSTRFSATFLVKHGFGGLYRAYLRASSRFAAGSSGGVVLRGAPAPVKRHSRRR